MFYSSSSARVVLNRRNVPSSSSSSPSITRGFPYFSSSLISSSPLKSAFSKESLSMKDHRSIHDFTVKDGRGNDVDLSIYKGKVLLIVNVVSQCRMSELNYDELNKLYEKYKNQGLEILAFPCNQFDQQEPGNIEQILEVVCTRFRAEFPIFDKIEVNGENAAPLYKFLKSNKNRTSAESIKGNFSKFLVHKDGHVINRYSPTISLLSIEKHIKKLLGVS